MLAIYLTGFMGSGKTSVGRCLAEQLGVEFVDLDKVIEAGEGKSISEIFSGGGEDFFRSRESMYLRSMARDSNVVVATGGGTPCFHDNMQWMNEHGITIYLSAVPEVLMSRLQREAGHRPMLREKSGAELRQLVQTILESREEYYSRAHHIINTGTLRPEEIARRIQALLA